MREPAQALAFVDDDGAELFVQLGGQIGIGQHLGVPADRCERRTELMRHIADESGLAAFFEGEVVLLDLRRLGEHLEIGCKLIGFKQTAVRLKRHVDPGAVCRRLFCEMMQRFGYKMTNDQA